MRTRVDRAGAIGSISCTSLVAFLANPQVKLRPNWNKEILASLFSFRKTRSWRILGAALAKDASSGGSSAMQRT